MLSWDRQTPERGGRSLFSGARPAIAAEMLPNPATLSRSRLIFSARMASARIRPLVLACFRTSGLV